VLLATNLATGLAFAKDVSNEIKTQNSGLILGCITRLDLYAANAKDLVENQNLALAGETYLKVAIPYRENIRNAAWAAYPTQDWEAFLEQQSTLVNMNYQTNNVYFDTMTCVQDLMLYGVMYPKNLNPDEMPAEQKAIIKSLMENN
jgi:hypothetical protein